MPKQTHLFRLKKLKKLAEVDPRETLRLSIREMPKNQRGLAVEILDAAIDEIVGKELSE